MQAFNRATFSLIFLLTFSALSAQNSGDRDATFNVGTGLSHIVNTVGLLPNGNIFVGGDFDFYNGQSRTGIVVLQPNGVPDPVFSANASLDAGSDVRSGFVEPNGYILIGGFFNTVNGFAQNKLARFKPNGHRDSSFTVGTGPNNEVTRISSNGQKIAISGFFSQYNGSPRSGFAYLNANGTLDANFSNPSWSSFIRTQHVLPNNKVLVGGNFSSVQSAPFNRIARLMADGSVDTSFNPGTGANGPVEAIALQPNGQILIGGSFTSVNGQTCNRVARLHPNGSLDTSFDVQLGANSTVRALAVTATGKIVVAGQFLSFNGASVNFIVQLNANGSVDGNFATGSGFNGSTHALAIQPDNRILVGGAFTQFQGSASARLIRLHGDSIPATPVVPIFAQPQFVATCFGDTVVLEITGGNIDTANHWEWRLNDCLAPLLDTGTVVKFAPQTDTTTFAVKSSGAQTCTFVNLIVADTVAPQLASGLPAISQYCEVSMLPQDAPVATDFCVGPVVGIPQGPLNYTTPGNYILPWLFDDGKGNTSTYNQQIEVKQIDTAVIYDTIIPWILRAVHTTPTAKYRWVQCVNGQFLPLDPADTLQDFLAIFWGEYAVIITEGSCADTSSCKLAMPWDVPEYSANHFLNVYPNPAKKVVQISYPQHLGNGTLQLFSLSGEVLLAQELIAGTPTEISISELPGGVYMLHVVTSKATMTHRLLRQ
jgi:uncharacterized delta-60 repeat protein